MPYIPHPLINLIGRALQECAQYEISPDLLVLLAQDSHLLAALQRLSLCWFSTHVSASVDDPHVVEADAWIVK